MSEYAALHKKLMFDKFPKKLIHRRPRVMPELDGLSFDTRAKGVYGLVFEFVFSLDEMADAVHTIAASGLLEEGGCLYLAYPKKGNKAYKTFIHRDAIFPRLGVDGDSGFVAGTPLAFFKMAALNETFTVAGLRLCTGNREPKKRVSSRAADYIEKMPELRAALKDRPAILAAYNALSGGYQKDWARYVYSAKTSATTEKRLVEMAEILKAGYKSKDLYRRRGK